MKKYFKSLFSCITGLAMLFTMCEAVFADENDQLQSDSISYGQTLGSAQLLESTVGGVPGVWAWTDPSTKPDAGTADYEATFTPNDTANYNTVTAMISVTTEQATPTAAAVPAAAEITYGQTLGASGLSGGRVTGVNSEDLAGTWAWADTAIKLEAGKQDVSVTFTPESSNYKSITATVQITVKQFTPESSAVIAPAAGEITYGQSLADSALTGGSVNGADGAALPGAWSWNDAAVKPTAGTAEYAATFTPNDMKNYTPVTVNVSVTTKKYTVDPSNPDNPYAVAPPTAGEITYGQSLGDSALTGGSVNGIEGTFAWNDASIMPNAGTTSYEVIFTPTDASNYESFTVSVTVTIAKATPALADNEKPTAAQITYGQSLSDSALTVSKSE